MHRLRLPGRGPIQLGPLRRPFRAAGIGVASNGESSHSCTTSAAARPNATTRTGCHLRLISARRRKVKSRQSSSGASRSRSEGGGRNSNSTRRPRNSWKASLSVSSSGARSRSAQYRSTTSRTLAISASDKPKTTTPSTAFGGPFLTHGTNARSAGAGCGVSGCEPVDLAGWGPVDLARTGALGPSRIFSSRARAAARSAGEPRAAGAARSVSAPSSRLSRCSSASRPASRDVSRSRSPISCCTLRVPFSRAAWSRSPRWRASATSSLSRLGPVRERRDALRRRQRLEALDRSARRSLRPNRRPVRSSRCRWVVACRCDRPSFQARPSSLRCHFRERAQPVPRAASSMHSQMTGLRVVSRSMVGHLEQEILQCRRRRSASGGGSPGVAPNWSAATAPCELAGMIEKAPTDARLGKRPPGRLSDQRFVVRRGFP